jgi:hypothetical protein
MQALTSSFDLVPLIMMAVASLLFIVSIVILWPYLQREHHADAEETRILEARAQAIQATFDRNG